MDITSWTWKEHALCWIAEGTIGKYRIRRSTTGRYVVDISRKSGGPKRLGDAPSLAMAQQWAAEYDGYRANAR